MRNWTYQVSLGFADVKGSLGRVIILWLTVLIATVSSLLAVVVWQDAGQSQQQLASFNATGAVDFQLVNTEPAQVGSTDWPAAPLDGVLRQALTPSGGAATAFTNYPESPNSGRLLICLGYWPQLWPYAANADHGGVLIGAHVTDVQVGDVIDLGAHTERVIARLPAGMSVITSPSAWAVPFDLNDSLVFLTDYGHFVDTFNPDTSTSISDVISAALLFLRVYDWSDSQIQGLVSATAQSMTPWRLLPRSLVDNSVGAQIQAGATIMTWVAVGLTLLALVSFLSVLLHTMTSTLGNQSVHRLLGATTRDVRLRMLVFVATSFALPALLVVVGWSLLPIPELGHLRPYLWWVAAVIFGFGMMAVETSSRIVANEALLLAT